MQSGDSVNNNDEHEITGSLSWINNVYATSYITLTKILRRRQQIN